MLIPVEHCNSSRRALGGTLRQQCRCDILVLWGGKKIFWGMEWEINQEENSGLLNPKRRKRKLFKDSKQCDVKFVVFCKN